MQIFVPYKEPLEVAKCLDRRRLNKQIIETRQIINAITGVSAAWFNHPVVHMYRNHLDFLSNYERCLYAYFSGSNETALMFSNEAVRCLPEFINDDLCNQHKRRLYTKDNVHYKQFSEYGESLENWYIIGGELIKYNNGKKVK